MTRIHISAGGAVDCRSMLDVPLSAVSVWGQIRDFRRFARLDFFHARIEIDGDVPRAGAFLRMTHQFVFFKVQRIGRIAWWREGLGFSFSDLSLRGVRHGFPHVFGYRIRETGPARCQVEVRVRGLWTARRVPRWLARLWLRWVFSHAVSNVNRQLLAYKLWRDRRPAIS